MADKFDYVGEARLRAEIAWAEVVLLAEDMGHPTTDWWGVFKITETHGECKCSLCAAFNNAVRLDDEATECFIDSEEARENALLPDGE